MDDIAKGNSVREVDIDDFDLDKRRAIPVISQLRNVVAVNAYFYDIVKDISNKDIEFDKCGPIPVISQAGNIIGVAAVVENSVKDVRDDDADLN